MEEDNGIEEEKGKSERRGEKEKRSLVWTRGVRCGVV